MAVCILLAAPAENRSANRNCRALIHRVYMPVGDWLTSDDARSIAEELALEEEAILDVYVERTGQDREFLFADRFSAGAANRMHTAIEWHPPTIFVYIVLPLMRRRS